MARVPRFRGLPGTAQTVIAIALMAALWGLASFWLDSGTAALVGIVVGGVLLTLWEAATGGTDGTPPPP